MRHAKPDAPAKDLNIAGKHLTGVIERSGPLFRVVLKNTSTIQRGRSDEPQQWGAGFRKKLHPTLGRAGLARLTAVCNTAAGGDADQHAYEQALIHRQYAHASAGRPLPVRSQRLRHAIPKRKASGLLYRHVTQTNTALGDGGSIRDWIWHAGNARSPCFIPTLRQYSGAMNTVCAPLKKALTSVW